MRLLDKYILRNFLTPFLLCFFGFLAIWLVFDLSDNATDFIEGKANARFILYFYLTQLPQIAVISLPIGLLLALLYSLSRMSRSNEIIAMLTAGRSLHRMLLPLMAVGLLVTGLSLLLNYKLAPHAESAKKQLLDQLGRKRDKVPSLEEQLFRNRSERRTWYVQKMPAEIDDHVLLQGLHITQQDAKGNIVTKWYARQARYTPVTKTWQLERGKTVEFDQEGDIVSDSPWQKLAISGWNETPWRIASSNLDAQALSIPELHDYLEYNADFPDEQLAPYRTHLQHRWALPWACLIVVFLAAPLGIVYSRRGVLAGVAWAIFLFAGNTFLGYLMLALGKGGRVSPFTAAWGANLLFLAIGAGLLYFRSTNRDFPRPSQWFRSR